MHFCLLSRHFNDKEIRAFFSSVTIFALCDSNADFLKGRRVFRCSLVGLSVLCKVDEGCWGTWGESNDRACRRQGRLSRRIRHHHVQRTARRRVSKCFRAGGGGGVSGGMLPQKMSKSRRSKMPFLAFSWWYFYPNIRKIHTNFNSIYVCYHWVPLF